MRSYEIRTLISQRRPEWKGKVWVYQDCINVRGVGSVFPRYAEELSAEQEVDDLILYLDDLTRD